MLKRKFTIGFTLSELLIALAILGVIATFSIPKVLNSSRSEEWNATAKETAAALSNAVITMRSEGNLSASTSTGEITNYINYVEVVTNGYLIDHHQNFGPTITCDSSRKCIRMHNGGMLAMYTSHSFCNTEHTNALSFYFDPDGKVTDGNIAGNGRAIQFYVGATGRILTRDATPALPEKRLHYSAGGGCVVISVAPMIADPPWFSW